MSQMSSLRHFFEKHGFTVSTRLADSLGMTVKSVRLFFIYASFTTIVGGFIIYLTLAFWLNSKTWSTPTELRYSTYDVKSFSPNLFTVFFIMMSLTVFAYGIKELTQFVLTENIFEKIKQKK